MSSASKSFVKKIFRNKLHFTKYISLLKVYFPRMTSMNSVLNFIFLNQIVNDKTSFQIQYNFKNININNFRTVQRFYENQLNNILENEYFLMN